jgi:hypothetical protein
MDNCESKLVENIRIKQKKFVEIEKKINNIEEDFEYYQELELDKDKLEKQLNQTTKELVAKKSNDIYSNITDIYKKIEEIDVELKEKDTDLKKFNVEKEVIEKELEKLSIDLVEQKKIEWVNMSFEDWFNASYDEQQENFWIYSTDCGTEMGIWKGYDELNANDLDHFDTFELDYFYYGGPNYYNIYYPNSEMSEAEMARENGCAHIKRILRHDL